MDSKTVEVPTFSFRNFVFLWTLAFILFDILWDMPERRRIAIQRDPQHGRIFRECDRLEQRLLQLREAVLDDEEAKEEIDHLLKLTRNVRFEEEGKVAVEANTILWFTYALQRLFYRLVNLGVAALMIFGGIVQFFSLKFQSIILGCYVIIFGLATALLEFQIPPQVSRYASFLFSFIGRGVFYMFIGSILLSDHILRIISGAAIGVIGVAYCILEFVPSIEPPQNMREADVGWGAEQV
ncbi:hypothetical protein B7463_g8082, partial [Scytalidium lignicola]